MSTNPIAEIAARVSKDAKALTPMSALEIIGTLHDDLGEIARIQYRPVKALHHLPESVRRGMETACRLRSIAAHAALFLQYRRVKDPVAEFAAEYARAAIKHPGMTLDADGHTDESRFYALAEEVGEVAASLTYDNGSSTGHNADTIAEITQVGALALAWLTRYQDGGER